MANSIALAEKFQPILDELYKLSSLTSRMDAPTKPVSFAGANVVNIFKTSIVGLGTYDRSTGYPKGDVTGTWETLTLALERAREFSIDRMDDEESLGMAFGTLAGEFMRLMVTPEIDAYRFSTFAGWSGISAATPAVLAAGDVLDAIDAGNAAMDDDEVPSEGRLIFIANGVYQLLKGEVSRTLGNDSSVDRRVATLDGRPLIVVPQGRFYKGITLDAGATSSAGGYAKTAVTGRDINFMIIHPSAVLQATKLAQLKVFTPDENQEMDAYKVQFRLYHDAFVYDNKVSGIYSHISTS